MSKTLCTTALLDVICAKWRRRAQGQGSPHPWLVGGGNRTEGGLDHLATRQASVVAVGTRISSVIIRVSEICVDP